MKTLGSTIKKQREQHGLTQFYMAMELGISQAAYAHLEAGITRISVERALEISRILEVKLDDLLNSKVDKTLNTPEASRLDLIEEKLSLLQNEISTINSKISSILNKQK